MPDAAGADIEAVVTGSHDFPSAVEGDRATRGVEIVELSGRADARPELTESNSNNPTSHLGTDRRRALFPCRPVVEFQPTGPGGAESTTERANPRSSAFVLIASKFAGGRQ